MGNKGGPRTGVEALDQTTEHPVSGARLLSPSMPGVWLGHLGCFGWEGMEEGSGSTHSLHPDLFCLCAA